VPQDERTFAHLETSPLQPKAPMLQPVSVFPRFEVPGEATKGEAKNPKQQAAKNKSQPQVNREIDISQLDIRVGVITKAWAHEEADKLICEEIDIGEETGPRQIASGLRGYYNADDLEGQRVLVLSNLKSRKLVGFPSHGMVLCASKDDKTEFVEPPADAVIGERIFVEGFPGDPATENQVGKKKMLDGIFPDLKTNDEGVATYKGVALTTSAGICKAQTGIAGADVA
jgi:aminoacyl tRNA synthase complex-interacting multifunctional protein 1